MIAVLYPGVPYVACAVLDFWVTHSLAEWAGALQLTTVLAVIGTVAGLVRSAMKGAAQVGHETTAGRVLSFFRLQVAPRLGGRWPRWSGTQCWSRSPHPTCRPMLRRFPAVAKSLFPDSGQGLRLGEQDVDVSVYRNHLEFAFFRRRPVHDAGPTAEAKSGATGKGNGAGAGTAAHLPGLADFAERGQRPELVLCATANVRDGDLLPCGRNGTPFILSSRVGFTDPALPGGDYRPEVGDYRPEVGDYRPGGGLTLDVATAAISGAAVAPLAGRDKSVRAYGLLLALANVRLGVWIRNPYWTSGSGGRPWIVKVNHFFDKASPYQVVQEALGTPTIYDPHLYVTDGICQVK